MKKILFAAATIIFCLNVSAQQGQKYSVGGNNMSNGDILGSLNAVDVVVTTNSAERFRFTSTGELKATAFSGNGTGLLQYDNTGHLCNFPLQATPARCF